MDETRTGSQTQAQAHVESPATQLRHVLDTYFDQADLEAVCFDLGLDYDGLGGSNKSTKIIELIQYCARTGRLTQLIDVCSKQRPNVPWDALREAAVRNPALFQAQPTFPQPSGTAVLNTSPDRALKIGIALGAIMVLLLVLGFGGGLLAGQVIDVTINPVQPDPKSLEQVKFEVGQKSFTPESANATFEQTWQLLTSGRLPPGTPVTLWLDDVQATTIADELIQKLPNSPVTEVHVRFLNDGQIVINARLKATGDRRVVLAYTVRAEGGRVILTPASAWLNLIEVPGTTFGWVPLPQSMMDTATQWAQGLLDNAARNFYFEDVQVTNDLLVISGTTK